MYNMQWHSPGDMVSSLKELHNTDAEIHKAQCSAIFGQAQNGYMPALCSRMTVGEVGVLQ